MAAYTSTSGIYSSPIYYTPTRQARTSLPIDNQWPLVPSVQSMDAQTAVASTANSSTAVSKSTNLRDEVNSFIKNRSTISASKVILDINQGSLYTHMSTDVQWGRLAILQVIESDRSCRIKV
jgi:hypothetical protein